MNLNVCMLTNNACYKAGRKITPKGVMVHSTGANNPNLKRYVGPDDGKLGYNQYGNHWNQDKPDGREVCAHAFIGKLADGSVATYQTLPVDGIAERVPKVLPMIPIFPLKSVRMISQIVNIFHKSIRRLWSFAPISAICTALTRWRTAWSSVTVKGQPVVSPPIMAT